MNYFAHGLRYLHNPWFLAGTATPDWLSVADRKVRLRERHLGPFLETENPNLRSMAAGVLQHLHDDGWFHQTVAFHEVTSAVADCFRALPDQNDGYLPGFLGHISTELLLDRFLIEQFPGAVDEYSSVLGQIPAEQIQEFVNMMAVRKTGRLTSLVELFHKIRFLRDYTDSRLLLRRLNQVLLRVKLEPLPERAEYVLESAWGIVSQRSWDLLPADKYDLRTIDIKSPNIQHTPRRTST